MSKFSSKEIQKYVREETSRKVPIDEDKLQESQALDRVHMEWLMNA
jgi:hypothetical protein